MHRNFLRLAVSAEEGGEVMFSGLSVRLYVCRITQKVMTGF